MFLWLSSGATEHGSFVVVIVAAGAAVDMVMALMVRVDVVLVVGWFVSS